jgi:hypothetical protein
LVGPGLSFISVEEKVLGWNEPRGEGGWKLGEGDGELEEWETSKFFEKGRIGLGGQVVWGLMKIENNSKKRKLRLANRVHSQESMIKSP